MISFECGEPCGEISPCVDPWLVVVMKIFDHALLFLKGPCMLGSVRGKACKARLKAWKARSNGGGGGIIQLFNPKFHQIKLLLLFKKKNVKCILTSLYIYIYTH